MEDVSGKEFKFYFRNIEVINYFELERSINCGAGYGIIHATV